MEKERKRYIMTIQEKKQVLAQYQTTKREIIRLTKERDDWNDLAYRISANYSDTVVSGGCKVDKIQTSIEQMDRITQLICDRIEQLVLLKQQIEEAIQGIDDQVLRLLLEYRYINGFTWERVAEEINYDYRHTIRLHRKALEAIECHFVPVIQLQ